MNPPTNKPEKTLITSEIGEEIKQIIMKSSDIARARRNSTRQRIKEIQKEYGMDR